MIATNAWYLPLLICPDCGASLADQDGCKIGCRKCGFSRDSSFDLRAKNPPPVIIKHPRVASFDWPQLFSKIDISRPELCYQGPLAKRDSRLFMSVIQNRLSRGSRILDLGCGPRDQVVPLEHLGHSYVGFDYVDTNADFLADAHAIPFADSSFDCVFSYAVLEHLHNPWVALHEVHRVLKPGGIYIGTVSQGEPFHESYFHHTPWAFVALVSSIPTFRIGRLWPSMDTLQSLSRIGRYPKVIARLLRMVDILRFRCPWLAPRKMKWPEHEKAMDELYRAGSLCFCVEKADDADSQRESNK